MSSIIPESAPFSAEQRAWLNGFFSGLMGISAESNPVAALQAAGIATEAITAPEGEQESVEEDFPWHDSALPIVDRMELANEKPVERKLMAAMAQLDCGSCGYVCQTYAEAIASGEESNLTLCSPGGKETKQMIKRLLKERESVEDGHAAADGVKANGTSGAQPGWTRKNPYSAKLIESRPLNGAGSKKDTRHIAIDLSGSGLKYEAGDALGVYPSNCPELVARIVECMGADASVPVTSPMGNLKPLSQALAEDCCLRDPTDELIELVEHCVSDNDSRQFLRALLDEGVDQGIDVLDVLQAGSNPTLTATATEVMESLEPLNPRLYSIASSMKHVGDQVHLTVGKVTFEREGRLRKGAASTMLADRVSAGEAVRVFVQPNHGGFTIPADPTTPMIMVGPGTGIAPFLAFLQERAACSATGKNWLFFGDQHESCDFLYEDQLRGFQQSGILNRLDTAFSRDGDQKLYVQHRMHQNAAELWDWLCQGAHFYVCGDASRMAADVDRSLVEIVAREGKMSDREAKAHVAQMMKDKRYVRDVY